MSVRFNHQEFKEGSELRRRTMLYRSGEVASTPLPKLAELALSFKRSDSDAEVTWLGRNVAPMLCREGVKSVGDSAVNG